MKKNKLAQNIEDNWINRIERIKSLIKTWSRRDLSIHGKIIIAKCFLISQLVFVMQTIGLPGKILKEINRIIYKFIWQRKYSNKKAFEKVKRITMENTIEHGDLNMMNLEHLQDSLYLQWAGRIAQNKNKNWAAFAYLAYGNILSGLNCFDVEVKESKALEDKINNPFWKKVLITHFKYKSLFFKNNINENNFCNQILLHNDNIKYRGKSLYFGSWIKAGLEKLFTSDDK